MDANFQEVSALCQNASWQCAVKGPHPIGRTGILNAISDFRHWPSFYKDRNISLVSSWTLSAHLQLETVARFPPLFPPQRVRPCPPSEPTTLIALVWSHTFRRLWHTHVVHPVGPKASSSPYDLNYSTRSERAPFVRIHSPSLEIAYGHLNSYDAFEGRLSFFSAHSNLYFHNYQMLNSPFLHGWTSGHCSLNPKSTSQVKRPSISLAPHWRPYCLSALSSHSHVISRFVRQLNSWWATYLCKSWQCLMPFADEPLDGNIFHNWAYNGHANNYDSRTVVPDLASHPNTFSPTTSLVSCSPRSDHSGLSLSPQPPEHSHALKFDYSTSLPHEFPSSTTSSPTLRPSHSPKSPLSHFSTPSCSSVDEKKRPKSRDISPSRPDNDARRRFPCLIIGCERRFTSQYTLKVHMEAHKPKPRTSFPCTLGCNERFSRQHDRLRHEVAKHGKICEFSCDECGRFFSTRKTLGNHKCPVAQGGTRWVTSWSIRLCSSLSLWLSWIILPFVLGLTGFSLSLYWTSHLGTFWELETSRTTGHLE